jgi:hypothetical protein
MKSRSIGGVAAADGLAAGPVADETEAAGSAGALEIDAAAVA